MSVTFDFERMIEPFLPPDRPLFVIDHVNFIDENYYVEFTLSFILLCFDFFFLKKEYNIL